MHVCVRSVRCIDFYAAGRSRCSDSLPPQVWLENNKDGLRLMGMEMCKIVDVKGRAGPLAPVLTPFQFMLFGLARSADDIEAADGGKPVPRLRDWLDFHYSK